MVIIVNKIYDIFLNCMAPQVPSGISTLNGNECHDYQIVEMTKMMVAIVKIVLCLVVVMKQQKLL